MSPQSLYEEEEEEAAPFSTTLSSSLGLNLPNPAPEIDMEAKNNPGKISCFQNKTEITMASSCNSISILLGLIVIFIQPALGLLLADGAPIVGGGKTF